MNNPNKRSHIIRFMSDNFVKMRSTNPEYSNVHRIEVYSTRFNSDENYSLPTLETRLRNALEK